jgi:hypothetical protein
VGREFRATSAAEEANTKRDARSLNSFFDGLNLALPASAQFPKIRANAQARPAPIAISRTDLRVLDRFDPHRPATANASVRFRAVASRARF